MLLSSRLRSLLLLLVILAVVLVTASGTGQAQVPLRSYYATFDQMIAALQTRSYDRFIAEGDARFRSGFTQKMFEELSSRLGPRLVQGYTATFLATVHQQDYMAYLWKLTFKDGKDEFVVFLFIKNGDVTGFVTR